MKPFIIHLRRNTALVAAIVLSACAANRPLVLAQAVGPGTVPSKIANEGCLIVYSDADVSGPIPNYQYPVHSNYKIFTADGSLLRSVVNQSGSFYTEAVAVHLPPGRYLVRAKAKNIGMVDVPLVLAAGRTTALDLNRESAAPSLPQNDGVSLPDGWVVGPRAN